MTRYQKWICQPGNDKHFADYIRKRLIHQVRKSIDMPDGITSITDKDIYGQLPITPKQ
jgi:hypothetical protein